MNSETLSTENLSCHSSQRVVFTPLKQKRRHKTDAEVQTDVEIQPHEPVIVDARMELRRHRERMPRSGRPIVHWRRVTSPIELSELLPKRSRPPTLARVMDKVKNYRPATGHGHGIWALVRNWALEFR